MKLHQNWIKNTKIWRNFIRIFMILNAFWVPWETPNRGKCKKTHYYWSKTTLGHLFWHPKSTSKKVEIHSKSLKNL